VKWKIISNNEKWIMKINMKENICENMKNSNMHNVMKWK